MSNYFPTTNFKDSNNVDLGKKLVTKDYLISVYPQLGIASPTLFTWGFNSYGQLGNNTIASRSTPEQEFTSSSIWKKVASGSALVIAMKNNGTLWGWGGNGYGQVGDNTRVARSTPRQIGTATNWKELTVGGYLFGSTPRSWAHAIKTDGTLWGWGVNYAGFLGDNTTNSRSTPRQIGAATNWKQVTGGFIHTAAIKTDGTLWTWGVNDSGGLGHNDTSFLGGGNRSTPKQEFTSDTTWKYVSVGHYSTGAIKDNGTLWLWGSNSYGQIGDNTTNARSTPRQEITSSTNWKQVSCGYFFTAALRSDGTLWLWGRNNRGQLVDNTTDSRSTPQQELTSNTNWKQVSTSVDSGNVAAIQSLDIT